MTGDQQPRKHADRNAAERNNASEQSRSDTGGSRGSRSPRHAGPRKSSGGRQRHKSSRQNNQFVTPGRQPAVSGAASGASERLANTLRALDGRGYSSYKQLKGKHPLGSSTLSVDQVQVDPYAPPSKVRLLVDAEVANLPQHLTDDPLGRIAVGDFLTRRFATLLQDMVPAQKGGPPVSIGSPGQQVLERTSVLVETTASGAARVEARVAVAMPAAGRRIRGHEAARLLTELLPQVAEQALQHQHLDAQELEDHVALLRDQESLRGQLREAGLIAFVGEGSVLPRRAGDSDLPLTKGPVPFHSPDSLRTSFTLPSGRRVTGMGLPTGVSVIVGGGYHGKSTLLRAVERGVYPHIAGDGREWVITVPDAVTIRAEDERAVTGLDISPFITNLPTGADTRHFTTTAASGSTSQAANLMEALEAGSSTLLIDEDTSATNFMIRDERMQQLIPGDREPITPFVQRVRALYTERGVSTVLVAGGSGAFFEAADQVIALDAYHPLDVTDQAHRIAGRAERYDGATAAPQPSLQRAPQQGSDQQGSDQGSSALDASTEVFSQQMPLRCPTARSMNPGEKHKSARARGRGTIQYGREDIDVAAVAQLVDPAQTQAVAHALDRIADLLDAGSPEPTGDTVEARRGSSSASAGGSNWPAPELVEWVCARIDAEGLDWLSPFGGHPGHMARPRRFEIHAALNRYRKLRLHPQ